MHYEIEQAGPGHEHRPDVGTRAEPQRWHVVNVFNADAVPMPLRFDTLDQARTYVARTPGTPIMEVTDEGKRLPVETARYEARRLASSRTKVDGSSRATPRTTPPRGPGRIKKRQENKRRRTGRERPGAPPDGGGALAPRDPGSHEHVPCDGGRARAARDQGHAVCLVDLLKQGMLDREMGLARP